MIINDRITEKEMTDDTPQAEECLNGECGNCEWLWSNGQNYCPYCQMPIHG